MNKYEKAEMNAAKEKYEALTESVAVVYDGIRYDSVEEAVDQAAADKVDGLGDNLNFVEWSDEVEAYTPNPDFREEFREQYGDVEKISPREALEKIYGKTPGWEFAWGFVGKIEAAK